TIVFRAGDVACAGQPDGTACDDADPCTTADHCVAGTCATTSPCGAETTCAAAYCTARNGGCVEFDRPDGPLCDDGNPGPAGTVCQAGVCAVPTSTTTTTIPACTSAVRTPATIAFAKPLFASRPPGIWEIAPDEAAAATEPQAAAS